jgi:hypothetical protein
MAIYNRSDERGRKSERSGKPGLPSERETSPRQERHREETKVSNRPDDRSRLRENDLYERQSI